jgi:aspartyl-tRNA(Asn)/glutamyl-tRNA(Gln) amidotransferase subunit C
VSKQNIDQKLVKHVAQLAHIPISDAESQQLAKDFSQTLSVVDQLKAADVSRVETTHQVTGFKNITREDKVDESLSFTQAEALANAPNSKDGFFLVPQVLSSEDN